MTTRLDLDRVNDTVAPRRGSGAGQAMRRRGQRLDDERDRGPSHRRRPGYDVEVPGSVGGMTGRSLTSCDAWLCGRKSRAWQN